MPEAVVVDADAPFERLSEIVLGLERDGVSAVRLRGRDRDPFLLTAALAARTRVIRFVVETDTARTHPYTLARRLAALDKISAGRLDWAPHDTQPARRDEAVELVGRLLRSWPPEAMVQDRAIGVHVDTSLIEAVWHDGRYYSVHSPLDVPAGPQGEVPVAAEPGR